MSVRTVVLVEGASDRAAVETLAARRGLDLAAVGAVVVTMGGAGGATRAIRAAVSQGAAVCGLYDVGEEGFVARALLRHGLAVAGTRAELAALGFHACDRDLEDELVRGLGVEGALAVVVQEGEGDRFRTFSGQPEWRGRPAAERLHRFWGTTAGRKERFGRALAAAAPVEPPPIAALLDHVAVGAGERTGGGA
ncbi:TOPRIM nucleotidyl transferase/hydrolase domain-containing protein [Isoptericola variabilis]|uniref:OLD protein-like TOPRIM domain-containing protein n=1 Tax=Isoptericola variabilis (strain 225) TaxID=743718 RepID=F6FVX8_ISOV2|nr:TOPRIM nucleotidyl transferase/hydrolase domain-containing protein [Isoptericola variabilis]AEG44448.1 hypothetical protein Isova_1697 [Isoptericola variabilis 225]